MSDVAYSIKINFESIALRDTGDGDSAGDVYFVAEVGGKKVGPQPHLLGEAQQHPGSEREMGSASPARSGATSTS